MRDLLEKELSVLECPTLGCDGILGQVTRQTDPDKIPMTSLVLFIDEDDVFSCSLCGKKYHLALEEKEL